jgi:hypothetical protein
MYLNTSLNYYTNNTNYYTNNTNTIYHLQTTPLNLLSTHNVHIIMNTYNIYVQIVFINIVSVTHSWHTYSICMYKRSTITSVLHVTDVKSSYKHSVPFAPLSPPLSLSQHICN